jgi:hypothetical protein
MNLMYHDARYADHNKLAMHNAHLGSVDLEGKNFYYDNPLSSNSSRYPWRTCPCCVGNIPRTLPMMPTWTYAKDRDGDSKLRSCKSRCRAAVSFADIHRLDRRRPWERRRLADSTRRLTK